MTCERPIPLNRSELNYLAMEGVLGSVAMYFALRFDAPLPEGAMRRAMRRLVSVHPRLRGVVESRPFSHRLRILDDAQVDALFEEAYREVSGEGADLSAVERYVELQTNTRFDVARGLNFRAHFLVDATRPVLVFVLHHILVDGRAASMIVDDLMKLLNGIELEVLPLDPPSMLPAILPPNGPERRDSLRRSFSRNRRAKRALRAHSVMRLHTVPRGAFGPTGIRMRALPVSMQEIRRAASMRGCTIGSLLLAALAGAIDASSAKSGGDAATVRISVDLRKYYPGERKPGIGNYVATFLVPLTRFGSIAELAREAEEGMREGIAAFERREMSYPLLLQELATYLGPSFFRLGARVGKRFGWVPANTCHYSNLGDVDSLNRHGERSKLVEFTAIAPNVCPFFTTQGMNGQVFLAASFQRDELSDEDADALVGDVERTLVALCAEGSATASSPRQLGS